MWCIMTESNGITGFLASREVRRKHQARAESPEALPRSAFAASKLWGPQGVLKYCFLRINHQIVSHLNNKAHWAQTYESWLRRTEFPDARSAGRSLSSIQKRPILCPRFRGRRIGHCRHATPFQAAGLCVRRGAGGEHCAVRGLVIPRPPFLEPQTAGGRGRLQCA